MEPKYTAHKAHAAGIVSAVGVLASYGMARLTGIEAPMDVSSVQEALGVVAFAGLTGLASWVSAYFTTNKEKL